MNLSKYLDDPKFTKPTTPTINFGEHKGVAVADLDPDYIRWVVVKYPYSAWEWPARVGVEVIRAFEARAIELGFSLDALPSRAEELCREHLPPTQWTKLYEAYLCSPQWHAFRDRILDERGLTCEQCAGDGGEVHHLTYKFLGMERPQDVAVVCRECHLAITKRRTPSGGAVLSLIEGYPQKEKKPEPESIPGAQRYAFSSDDMLNVLGFRPLGIVRMVQNGKPTGAFYLEVHGVKWWFTREYLYDFGGIRDLCRKIVPNGIGGPAEKYEADWAYNARGIELAARDMEAG